MKRKSVPRPLDLVDLRHQLFLHRKYRAAIPRLRAHLKSSPNDAAAMVLLLDCYDTVKDWPNALAWSDRLLAIERENPEAWYARSSALLYLGDSEGAIVSARTGLNYVESLGAKTELADLYRDQLLGALWRSLMAADRYEEALAVAQGAPPQDPEDTETWVIYSLLALRRFRDAEALVAAHGDDFVRTTWRIGFFLGDQGQFYDALVYLRRMLAFVAQPATKDFQYVCAHAECTALLGDVQMLTAIVTYWSSRPLSRRRMQTLLILRIIATGVTDRQAAIQMIRDWHSSITDRTALRKVRPLAEFDPTLRQWKSLVSEALGG